MGLGFGLMGIGSVLVLAIIIIPIILLVNHTSSNSSQNTTTTPQSASNHALDILNERYARGEITDEEYRIKKEALVKK